MTNNQFWRHDNKSTELWSNKVIKQKIDYVHQNPVEAGFVYKAEDYVYSSARDYGGEKGLLDDIVVFEYLIFKKDHKKKLVRQQGKGLLDDIELFEYIDF